ncbi:MAG: type I restriction enzyme HsdR N-terminal domain-containing protein [Planctomycetales bacterium]|nr:type I restriction enzyme HsdR N-terminal domain-containing protein [Planctomycetales bacterium]
MDLIDRLKELSTRAANILNQLETEEATKNALVMPLINTLGYDVFNPSEVVPEFNADVGTKKGEKVDYAIMRDGSPIILFECKSAGVKLDVSHASQLYRYFSVTDARFGVLTNGIQYLVFSDLEAPNKMDELPFLEFSLLEINDDIADQLKRFAKDTFDLENILSTAGELKYTKAIKRYLREEWTNPSDEFVRIFASRVYQGRLTQSTKDQFTDIVKRAFHGFVTDRINERLKSALSTVDFEEATSSPADSKETKETSDAGEDANQIVTTEDELEGYYIVKSILREVVDAQRIFIRDTQSYCGVLLDDNNRKPICRLFFNTSQKYLGVFDADKNVTRHAIDDVNDIYKFADELKKTIDAYEGENTKGPTDARTRASKEA